MGKSWVKVTMTLISRLGFSRLSARCQKPLFYQGFKLGYLFYPFALSRTMKGFIVIPLNKTTGRMGPRPVRPVRLIQTLTS